MQWLSKKSDPVDWVAYDERLQIDWLVKLSSNQNLNQVTSKSALWVSASAFQRKRLEVVVHGLNRCPKIVTNRVGSHPKCCDERSKEKESVIASTVIWCPNVGILHVFTQVQSDAGCFGQSAAQYRGQWWNPSLPDGHSIVRQKRRNQILRHPWFGSIFNNVTDYVVCLRSAVISDTKRLKI